MNRSVATASVAAVTAGLMATAIITAHVSVPLASTVSLPPRVVKPLPPIKGAPAPVVKVVTVVTHPVVVVAAPRGEDENESETS